MATPIVTVFGGSGFVGRYICQRLARAGWRVRVAVRRPNEAGFVRPYGAVGQVEPLQANLRDEASTRRAIQGADAVVNCVGIMVENGKQTFGGIVEEGAARVARLAAEAGCTKLVHISSIGADAGSDSAYAAAKGKAEAAVTAAFPGAVILRPSVIFGSDDTFLNRFGAMARTFPVLPVIGAETKFQPVYVDDVAAAAVAAVTGDVAPGVYELGGPEVLTFRQLMERVLTVTERRRLLVTMPGGVARLMARTLDFVQRLTGGLVENGVLTQDQLRLLGRDNVVAAGAPGLEELGVKPTAMEAVLEGYMYAYRPHGQFDEITASARNLRGEQDLRA